MILPALSRSLGGPHPGRTPCPRLERMQEDQMSVRPHYPQQQDLPGEENILPSDGTIDFDAEDFGMTVAKRLTGLVFPPQSPGLSGESIHRSHDSSAARESSRVDTPESTRNVHQVQSCADFSPIIQRKDRTPSGRVESNGVNCGGNCIGPTIHGRTAQEYHSRKLERMMH
ncbi:hypothetical protein GY45DRAFT_1140221 [Cubamyces sp. BRFM 1775]|nr:hypothetical protein GY45DRAFT_1140221 [Cubamyces sp. BRFM 1775]